MTAVGALDRPEHAASAGTPGRVRRLAALLSKAGRGRRWRWVLLGGVLVVVVLGFFDLVVAEFMHDRRQARLVSEFNAAATSPDIAFGDPVALLQIPTIGVNDVVIEGDTSGNLRAGPGHRLGTALPGSAGNAVVSGKSHRYGSPFAHLGDLEPGDEVFVARRASQPVRYVVDRVDEVGASDSTPFQPSAHAQLTLVTAAGWLSRDQIVVTAYPDPDVQLEPPVGVTASPRVDRVGGGDLGVFAVWLTALAVLVAVARRSGARLPKRARLAVLGPLLIVVTLELVLNAERLLPANL